MDACYQGTGRKVKPPLIYLFDPAGCPFHNVGVDITELPLTSNENKYNIICFIDYLTKWVESLL